MSSNDDDDLTQFVQQESPTLTAIYAHWKKTGDAEPRRAYMGASIIGHACARYLWYVFRWCGREEFDGRMYRLFDRGDMEEYRITADLRAIGLEVHDIDPETGEQFAVSALGGHFSGHMDACLLGVIEAPKTWHGGEYKTHNAKSFAKLKAEGVRLSKPMHYGQMQTYMHLTGLTRFLYVACNKDTDELFIERVRYDREFAERQMQRAERIIMTSQPPVGITGSADSKYTCGYCPFASLCSGQTEMVCGCEINCRTCCYARPVVEEEGAKWACQHYNKELSLAEQERGCPDHLIVPGIIQFASKSEVGANPDGSAWVEYKNNANGAVWRNGANKADGQYSSVELSRLPRAVLESGEGGGIAALKKAFSGEVVNNPESIGAPAEGFHAAEKGQRQLMAAAAAAKDKPKSKTTKRQRALP